MRAMSKNWSRLSASLKDALGTSVRFDTAHRAVYASDASNYRQDPIGVVVPRSLDEFIQGVAICHDHRAPLLVRGGGTAMCGQSVNDAVGVDLSTYCSSIPRLDPQTR